MSTSPQTAGFDSPSDALPAWKQEVNARLNAHRSRRSDVADCQPSLPGMEQVAHAPRTARVAARVAERYAKAPTYSEVLAAETGKAARAAEAAAQAAREAHEAAQAVTEVLRAGRNADEPASFPQMDIASEPASASLPMQYHVDPATLPAARRAEYSQPEPRAEVDPYPHIVDPVEEAMVAPAQPLPVRVLEFPRELVAARKARPRLAEGPLREASEAQEKGQLRIFEVEPETISHEPISAPAGTEKAVLPEWSSIRLDAVPRRVEAEASAGLNASEESMRTSQSAPSSPGRPFSSRARRQTSSRVKSSRQKPPLAGMVPLHVAPLEDRLMAAIVDAALILCAFLLFVLVFVACTAHPPAGKPAMIAAAIALAGIAGLYQWLFFTYAENTPGMRYARIALCTFDDENPGRKSLQNRVGALILSVLPLGLGLLWVLFDDDRLCWHDRMTRTYQRSYR